MYNVDIYNADTERFYRFSCRPDGCELSTDQSEGSDQFLLDVDAGTNILRIRTSDVNESGSKNALAVEILSDTCNGVCTTTTVSGLNVKGTVFVRSFSAPNLGDPTGLRLTAQGPDWLELDWRSYVVSTYNSLATCATAARNHSRPDVACRSNSYTLRNRASDVRRRHSFPTFSEKT
ncbi:Multivesicular body subunit 12B [Branchiostoma belcheri]|nr:Multivesicular body subunit 12B [Branchiostoma belcheri]